MVSSEINAVVKDCQRALDMMTRELRDPKKVGRLDYAQVARVGTELDATQKLLASYLER